MQQSDIVRSVNESIVTIEFLDARERALIPGNLAPYWQSYADCINLFREWPEDRQKAFLRSLSPYPIVKSCADAGFYAASMFLYRRYAKHFQLDTTPPA